MNRILRFAFSLVFLCLAAPAEAFAAPTDLAADEPVRFLIESISVEGIDRAATREIVAKESGIEPGTEVDEDRLRQAIYRVKRLPFVIDADFSLQKGSERGRYVLVIRIEMASSIFADLQGYQFETSDADAGYIPGFEWSASVGARLFVGASGYAFGSIDRHGNLRAGYTKFHLFGPGSYLSVAGSTDVDDRERGYEVSISAGKPLSATQSIRGSVGYGDSDFSEGQGANLEWRFDSTDDPLLPTRGGTASVSAGYGVSHSRSRFDGLVFRSESRLFRLGAVAQRYWPISARQSVSGVLGASRYESETTFAPGLEPFESTRHSGSAGLGYSLDLLRSRVGEPRNDLRFSLSGLFTKDEGSYESAALVASLTYRRTQISIGLTFSYVDDLSRPRFNP